jgi:hypothetical protein
LLFDFDFDLRAERFFDFDLRDERFDFDLRAERFFIERIDLRAERFFIERIERFFIERIDLLFLTHAPGMRLPDWRWDRRQTFPLEQLWLLGICVTAEIIISKK